MEEEPPWELGCSPYLVKKVKEMKKMEEEVFGRKRERGDVGDSEKTEERGIYIVGRGLRAEIR